MIPVDFPGANDESNDTKHCIKVPLMRHVGMDKLHYITVAWLPSKEDMEAFIAGRPLMMVVQGKGFRPVTLYTNDENGEPNI